MQVTAGVAALSAAGAAADMVTGQQRKRQSWSRLEQRHGRSTVVGDNLSGDWSGLDGDGPGDSWT